MSVDLRAAAAGPLAGRLSPRYLEEHCLIPIAMDQGGVLSIAAGRPLDPTVTDELGRMFGGDVRVIDAPAAEIRAALLATQREGEPQAPAPGDSTPDMADLRELANQAPVVQFVNVMLLDALRAGASDVHVESTPDGARRNSFVPSGGIDRI